MDRKILSIIGMFLLILIGLSLVNASSFSLSNIDVPNSVTPGKSYLLKFQFNNPFENQFFLSLSGSSSLYGLPKNLTANPGDNTIELTVDIPTTANSFSASLDIDVFNDSSHNYLNSTLSTYVFNPNLLEISYCDELGLNEGGDLRISDFEIINRGRGDDDEWEILDKIEIEVYVENLNNDNRIRDVYVELKILDSSRRDVTRDFELDEEKIKIGTIRSDDEEKVIFVIPSVPIDSIEDDYLMYIAVYSEDDDSQCISTSNDFRDYGASRYYTEFGVTKEYDRGIILSETLSKLDVVCGQTVELPLELYNIGDERERKVLVHFFNNELGIDEKVIIDDFRAGKRRNMIFKFDIPKDLTRNSYFLDITTHFDWDDDDDEYDLSSYYENSRDDLDEAYGFRLDILSCEEAPTDITQKPIINAELITQDVNVEEDVLIKIIITNPSNQSKDYIVSVGGYTLWANLVNLNPNSLILGPGETREVLLTINPQNSGIQTFNVRVLGQNVDVSQDVSISINEKRPNSFLSYFNFGDNGQLLYWVAVALFILIIFLIIVILVVAFRRR
jgi:hypothetical protein